MSQSVLSYGYRLRYYVRHPIKFLRETRSIIKAAWWRITKGWCPGDCWEFAYWFLDVAPEMLDYLADHACGYPGNEKFPTYESWQEHLRAISNMLKNSRDEVRDKKNEYTEAHEKELETGWQRYTTNSDGSKTVVVSDSPTFNNYYNRDLELSREQDVIIEEAFKLLAETPFKGIWD